MQKLMLIGLLIIAGCKETELFKEKNELQLKQFSTSDLKIKYEGQDEPNKYDVRLTWNASKGYLVLKKNEQSFFDSSRTSNTNDYIFKNLVGGTKYSVIADAYSAEGNLLESNVLNISVPLDLAYEGSVQLDKKQEHNYQRIFFEDNTTIFTMQHDFKIAAVELIFGSNVKIQNFPNGFQANYEANGLNAGNIEIRGFIASGNLEVIQNSQAGGAGYQGTPKYTDCRIDSINIEREPPICTPIRFEACAGTSGGHAGALGDFKFFVDQSDELILKYKKEYPPGGGAGPHGSQVIGGYPIKAKPDGQCNVSPTNGAAATGGTSCVILSRSDIYDCQ